MKSLLSILGVWLVCQTAANVLFRRALAGAGPPSAGPLGAGILLAAAGFGLWLLVLRRVPLALANNYTAVLYLAIPLAAQVFLREAVSGRTWAGALLIAAGILLTGPPR